MNSSTKEAIFCFFNFHLPTPSPLAIVSLFSVSMVPFLFCFVYSFILFSPPFLFPLLPILKREEAGYRVSFRPASGDNIFAN